MHAGDDIFAHFTKLEKEKKRRPDSGGGKQRSPSDDVRRRHSRSMSGDRLAGMGGGHHDSSRRLSMLKVEDWQRYQQDTDPRASTSSPTGAMKRDSRSMPVHLQHASTQGVPFPADMRRKSRDYLN